jgi:hypothetical protein
VKATPKILWLSDAKRLHLKTHQPRCCLSRLVAQGHPEIVCIPQHGDLAEAGERIFQNL